MQDTELFFRDNTSKLKVMQQRKNDVNYTWNQSLFPLTTGPKNRDTTRTWKHSNFWDPLSRKIHCPADPLNHAPNPRSGRLNPALSPVFASDFIIKLFYSLKSWCHSILGLSTLDSESLLGDSSITQLYLSFYKHSCSSEQMFLFCSLLPSIAPVGILALLVNSN